MEFVEVEYHRVGNDMYSKMASVVQSNRFDPF